MTKGHHKTASFTVQPDSIEEQNETKLTALFVKEGNGKKNLQLPSVQSVASKVQTFLTCLYLVFYLYLISYSLCIGEKV